MTQSPQMVVAMDWGGTWTRVGVVDRQGAILWQSRVGNAVSRNKDELLGTAEGLLREAIGWCGPNPPLGVGLAIAGPVDGETGTLYQPPNLPMLDGVSLKTLWETNLGYPVWVGNDADLAALGHFDYGAGQDAREVGEPARTLVYVTVSTGIGGGVIDRGRVFLGRNGLAAEVGHMRIDIRDDAPKCQCGNRGCLEALASGTAVARIAREGVAQDDERSSTLSRLAPDSITSELVFQAAGNGDALALGIVDRVVYALGVGLTNVLHLYNPDLVVLGGGVTVGLNELGLIPLINDQMLDGAMSGLHKEFRLVASRLEDTAGMLGAAGLVWSAVDAAA